MYINIYIYIYKYIYIYVYSYNVTFVLYLSESMQNTYFSKYLLNSSIFDTCITIHYLISRSIYLLQLYYTPALEPSYIQKSIVPGVFNFLVEHLKLGETPPI